MKRFVSLMNGLTLTQAKDTLRLTLERLNSWLRNTAQKLIRVVLSFDYVETGERTLYQLKKRWHYLMSQSPARQEAKCWQDAYWIMYDDWVTESAKYQDLYPKYLDLLEEVRYWESRHAKVLNFIEKQMELSEGEKS